MKIVEKFQPKIVIFYSCEKSLYVAWACFRNGLGVIFTFVCLDNISLVKVLSERDVPSV